MNHRCRSDPLADAGNSGVLGGADLRQGAATALAHDHDDPALARLVLGQPPVDPVGGPVLRPDVATKIRSIDLDRTPFAADPQPLHAGRHGFAQLVRQHERRLVLHVQVAGEGEHAFALHLVAEHRDGQQIGQQRQLMPGEQGAGGRREVVATGLAAPARLTGRTATGIADRAPLATRLC